MKSCGVDILGMMKRLSREHFILASLAVVILGSFSLLSLLFYNYTPKIEIDFSVAKRNPTITEAQNYENNVKAIFRRYLIKRARLVDLTGQDLQTQWTTAVADAKKQLLGLTVSSDKAEKHLQLILSLKKISSFLAGKSLPDAMSIETLLIKLFNQI